MEGLCLLSLPDLVVSIEWGHSRGKIEKNTSFFSKKAHVALLTKVKKSHHLEIILFYANNLIK